jgi:3-oxoacyl-(acyl-carrier-protein) synthase
MARELHEVVLTGMGGITARGDMTLQNTTKLDDTRTFTLPDFKLENYLSSQKTYLDRCSALALAGCALALRDAGLSWPLNDDMSTHDALCGHHTWHASRLHRNHESVLGQSHRARHTSGQPAAVLTFLLQHAISLCAIEFGLKGYHTTFCAGTQSGIEAVRAAYDAIQLGHAAMMLCGGVEAWTPTRALLEADSNASIQLGEASVFFVLEGAHHAQARNAVHRIPLHNRVLQQAASDQSLYENYGNCGGAISALSLARLIEESSHTDS